MERFKSVRIHTTRIWFFGNTKYKITEIDYENINYISEERYLESPEIMLQSNDVLLAKDGSTLGTVNIISKLPFPCTVNSSIAVLRVKQEKLIPYFLRYFLSSEIMQQVINMIKGGMGVPHLFQSDINNFRLLLPTIKEQTTIAAFLDRKTAEIDSIIAKKERLIELYEEEKVAVINHAVTKGLDPDSKMKDSGIEWLGEIPEHWEVKRLKYVIESITGGGTPSTENKEFWNGNIPWVSPKDMKVDHIYETEDYVTEKAVEGSSTNLIYPERLLLVVRSGILKHSFPIAINKVAVCLNQDMKAIKPIDSILLNFLFWKIKGVSGYILTQCNKMGATVDSIEISELLDVIITYPMTEEQLAIVQHIETKCGHIDAIISKFKRQIELLKEYRTALISEAVTGKIDVRENMHN